MWSASHRRARQSLLQFRPAPLDGLATAGTGNGVGGWTYFGVDDATGTPFHPSIAGAGQHELIYTYTDAGCTVNDTLHITVEQALERLWSHHCEASPTMVIFPTGAAAGYRLSGDGAFTDRMEIL